MLSFQIGKRVVIPTTEAVNLLGMKSASSLYDFCNKGCITGFEKTESQDKFSPGKYTFYDTIRWVSEHSKETILARCLLHNLSRLEIKKIIGERRFRKLINSSEKCTFESDLYFTRLFKIIGLKYNG